MDRYEATYSMVPRYWPWHQKRTLKGPEKDRPTPSLHKDIFFAMKDAFVPFIDFVKLKRKWWSNSIIATCSCIKSTDDCGHTFTTQNGMVTFDCNMAGVSSASTSHITSRGTAANIYDCPFAKCCCSALRLWNVAQKWTLKGTHNNGKDFLTNTKDRTRGLNQRTLV